MNRLSPLMSIQNWIGEFDFDSVSIFLNTFIDYYIHFLVVLACALVCREAIGKILARGHSRIPVYEGHPKNIMGLLLVCSKF